MSADNWAVCPKCLSAAQKAHDEEAAKVYEQYGKVPPDEFDRLRAELQPVDPDTFRTFREDYEFYGAEEGEIHARYKGSCDGCGLSVDLEADKKFWPDSNKEAADG